MASLTERLLKNSTINETSLITESKIYGKKEMIPTPVPMVNVALSGALDGGLTPGFTMLAGPSKHFKTAFSLLMAAAYLRKYEDSILLFYDSEFGTPQEYFKTFNIDLGRVIHTPVTDIEELKHDITKQLEEIKRGDRVVIVIDSIGNLASRKETEDALDGKTAADMTRAKQLKSLFRIVTPKLSLKDIPLIAVNHTYKTLEMYSKDVVGGGTGSYYSADTIWIIGRQQEKEDNEVTGYNFVINVEKSRYVKEKSKIPITVSFSGGIQKWSGLLDIAVEGGFINKVNRGKNGTHIQMVDPETGEVIGDEVKLSLIERDKNFWITLMKDKNFQEYIKMRFQLVNNKSIIEDESE
jgi:RecA/RadA recombinase